MENNNSVTEKYPGKWKRLVGYYKPYKKVFFADMFFAFLGSYTSVPVTYLIINGNISVVTAPKKAKNISAKKTFLYGL